MAKESKPKQPRAQQRARSATPTKSPASKTTVALAKEDTEHLGEILDEAQALVDTMEASLRRFAQLVLRHAFPEDHKLGRDPEKHATPLYAEVIRRAGGPTLKLSAKAISLWVRIVAWERTITSEEFRRLDFTRKQYLLPLADPKRMADAAEHVLAFKLNEADTRAYAESLRVESGRAPVPRLTPGRANLALDRFTGRFLDHDALDRLEQAIPELDDQDARALTEAVERAGHVLTRLRTALRRRR